MEKDKITQPRNSTFSTRTGNWALTWNPSFAAKKNQNFTQAQRYIDSEVLRYCSPKVPFRSGFLDKSGTLGTVIGSGVVQYTAVYAKVQYYCTAQTRPYDANRGGKWFERMKVSNGKDILNGAKKIAAGG
ncbi:MAG: minor capsid protein [Blautia sp.]